MLDSTTIQSAAAGATQEHGFPPATLPYYGDYDENGVDLSLLRYMLSLTPRQRLERMQECALQTLKLLEYGRRHREAKRPSGH